MSTSLANAVTSMLENPFDLSPGRLGAAIASLTRRGVASALVRETMEQDGVEATERVLLATAHALACAEPRRIAHLLGPDVLPSGIARSLPHPRTAYVAIGAAAARCRGALDALQGTSRAMSDVRRATWAACFGDSLLHALVLARIIHDHDVLILGETGTGKESVAHAIQEGCIGPSDGSPAPRAALNAASVPDTLVAAELFGHAKGAFTGANEARLGRIRSAYGGSLFLDEVGDLGPATQVKLLRVIETDEVSPLGSDKTYPSSCRYVAATHKDLEAMVDAGQFRRDLYERLAGNVIRLPPLRERPEDIGAIGQAFVERHLPEKALPKTRQRIDAWLESKEARRHRWPGNVRELQNALRNLLLGLDPGHDAAARSLPAEEPTALPTPIRAANATMDQVVDWYVGRVLEESNQNVARAARVLGVDRTTVRRRISRTGRARSPSRARS